MSSVIRSVPVLSIILGAIFSACLGTAPGMAVENGTWARQMAQDRKELEQVNRKLERNQARLVTLNSQVRKLERQHLALLDLQTALNKEIHQLDSKIADAQSEESRLQEEMASIERRFEERLDRLGGGLARLYRLKKGFFLGALMKSSSLTELSRRYKYWRYVFLEDLEAIEEARRAGRALREKSALRSKARDRLEDLKGQKSAKKIELEKSLLQAKSVLTRLMREKKKAEDRDRKLRDLLAYIKRNIKRHQEAIEKWESDSPRPPSRPAPKASTSPSRRTLGKGDFRWPIDVQGKLPVAKAYGPSKGEGGTVYFNPGIDISLTGPTTVRASADGKVIHRGEMPDFGKVAFLDHGGDKNRIITVYGNLDSILVSVGESVTRGQALGTVGSSRPDGGTSTLHFEIRIDAEHQDPIDWIRRPEKPAGR